MRRRLWVAWVLAAWLPVAGAASAVEAVSMASSMYVDRAAAANMSGHADSAMKGCHGGNETLVDVGDHEASTSSSGGHEATKPCCNAGLCACSCTVSLSAISVDELIAVAPSTALRDPVTDGLVPSKPFAHPFRPPIR